MLKWKVDLGVLGFARLFSNLWVLSSFNKCEICFVPEWKVMSASRLSEEVCGLGSNISFKGKLGSCGFSVDVIDNR